MFEELRRILGEAGQPMDQEDLLDVLWLARRIPPGSGAPLAGRAPRVAGPSAVDTGSVLSAALPGADQYGPTGSGAGQPAAGPLSGGRQPPHLPVVSSPFATKSSADALLTPGARALGPTLRLGRALRPLKRRVPSRRHSELDEVATAELQADTRTPHVVLRNLPERWLRLALVIDDGVSMLLWERQCAELKALFERSGAFRQVQTYQIRYGAGSTDEVRLGRPWDTTAATRSVDSVTDASGRTMVLLVTDGAAVAWRDGRLRCVLTGWARSGPLAVIHTLPRRLWAGSGVRAGTWQVTSPRPGAPNSAWTVRDPVLPRSVARPPSVPVPVLDLTPGDFATWAAVNTVVGRPLPVRLWTPHPQQAPDDAPDSTSVRDFGRAASPEAVRLAAHLAAMAPVTVPVMQLVHSCLDRHQGAAPLAEVLLGGLLHPLPPSGDMRFTGRHRLFDFTAEAKDLLLDAVPTAELLACSRLVGERIESLLGRSSDFPAWLLDGDETAAAAPFAYLGPALQARLGLVGTSRAGAAVEVSSDAGIGVTVPQPYAEETSGWLSSEGFAGSLRLMAAALRRHLSGLGEQTAVTLQQLPRYEDGTDLPDWGFVSHLMTVVAGLRGEQPPAEVRKRLCAQYVEALLPWCPAQVREAFERAHVADEHANLLLLHLLLYLDERSGRARMREGEIIEDLSVFLGAQGIRLDRQSPRGSWDVRRHDLLWHVDGGHCLVEIRRTRSPFAWPGVMPFARSLGLSDASVGFLVVVDEDEKPDGPVPLAECAVGEVTDGGAVVALRFQNGFLPRPQTEREAFRVCIVVDTVGYEVGSAAAHRRFRDVLWEVLDHALRAAGVSRDACVRQDRGYGALVLLPQGVDEARAVRGFIDGLAQALMGRSMRLRVAMDLGAVEVRQAGVIGDAVVRAMRLADAAHARDPHSPYTLIMSEHLYRNVPELHGRLRRVRVDLKDFRAWAWLQSGPPEQPRRAGLPDRERSNAVLMGGSSYAALPALPRVMHGLGDLAGLLTDPSDGAFAAERTTVLADPGSRREMLEAIDHAAASAEDTLLVYFAGHALFDSVNGDLSLAVGDTRPYSPVMAVSTDEVREVVGRSSARHKAVVLDCYYRGSTQAGMLPGVFNIVPFPGDILVMAAKAQEAPDPSDGRYTAFTGELIRVLGDGLVDESEVLSLESVCAEVRRRLGLRNLRGPELGGDDAAGFGLARNRARPPR
ncbi:SAV_2336 N-terminal domain-related protein [Streptomyces sp. NPDC127079]|uniref:caspase, EACC1-associated type n=1 Tax=Streptomyces sp. NPDC127079 TaxID=3347132 RepID=UPI00365DBDEF